jgi:hypothetical protein
MRRIGRPAAELLADRHADQRVANPNGNSDEPGERRRETAEARSSAGENDLADSQRVRLALVELE